MKDDQFHQETDAQRLRTAWGRVGTATSGVTEARKYEDFDVFMERWETLQEQVAELKKVYDRTPRSQGGGL